MKSIIKYINESKKTIFDNINPKDFEWNSAYSVDSYIKKCKNEVRKFADEQYPDLKPYKRIEQLFLDSYDKFLECNINWSENQINDQYKYAVKIIKELGWSQFESFSLEQGWWVFMYWLKNKINKN